MKIVKKKLKFSKKNQKEVLVPAKAIKALTQEEKKVIFIIKYNSNLKDYDSDKESDKHQEGPVENRIFVGNLSFDTTL